MVQLELKLPRDGVALVDSGESPGLHDGALLGKQLVDQRGFR